MNADRITVNQAEVDPFGAVHSDCGRSDSTHHVFDRTLVHAMPDDWQRRYIALQREYAAAHAVVAGVDYRIEPGTWRYPDQLDYTTRRALTITFNVQGWACEQNHGHDQDCDPDECDPHQTAAWDYYDAQGEQIQGRVFLPAPHIPHNRRSGLVADLGHVWSACHHAEQVRQLLALHHISAATHTAARPAHSHSDNADTVVVYPVTRLDLDEAACWSQRTATALTTVPGWVITPPPPEVREVYGAALAVRLPTTDGGPS